MQNVRKPLWCSGHIYLPVSRVQNVSENLSCFSIRPNGSCLSQFLLMNLLINLLIAFSGTLFYSIHTWSYSLSAWFCRWVLLLPGFFKQWSVGVGAKLKAQPSWSPNKTEPSISSAKRGLSTVQNLIWANICHDNAVNVRIPAVVSMSLSPSSAL